MSEAKEKTVTIVIPKTRKDQDDVFVSVNDRTWLIKRGVPVEVPACVAEVITTGQAMREAAMEMGNPVS